MIKQTHNMLMTLMLMHANANENQGKSIFQLNFILWFPASLEIKDAKQTREWKGQDVLYCSNKSKQMSITEDINE